MNIKAHCKIPKKFEYSGLWKKTSCGHLFYGASFHLWELSSNGCHFNKHRCFEPELKLWKVTKKTQYVNKCKSLSGSYVIMNFTAIINYNFQL